MVKQEYKNTDSEVAELIQEVFDEWFPDYSTLMIRSLFYYKKRTSRGRITFAGIRKATELEQHLMNNFEVKYILIIDGNIWEELTKEEKIRLLRHEMRHIYTYSDKKGEMKYAVADHNLIDFREDYALEHGEVYQDPYALMSAKAHELYERLEEAARPPKPKKRGISITMESENLEFTSK